MTNETKKEMKMETRLMVGTKTVECDWIRTLKVTVFNNGNYGIYNDCDGGDYNEFICLDYAVAHLIKLGFDRESAVKALTLTAA